MACNVFGNPITDETLKGMPEYMDKEITRIDRAHVALIMKNTGDKAINVRRYVENLKCQWGGGVSTLCLVYNATGDTINYLKSHDYCGQLGLAPYLIQIANGQWGGFLHGKINGAVTGSTGAIVYRGKNQGGSECEWMFGWCSPWNRFFYDNSVYTMIAQADNTPRWNYLVYGQLSDKRMHHDAEWNGCVSHVSTGSSTSPIVEAILTLKNA